MSYWFVPTLPSLFAAGASARLLELDYAIIPERGCSSSARDRT